MTVFQEYTEGKTTFLTANVEHYTREKGQPTTDMPVFYNPRMRINRDFSVLALSAYSAIHPLELMCEPLAGSGIRTLRYLNEVEGDFKALLFDANPNAIETANKNIELNGFVDRARTERGDAKHLLISESRGRRFDFVDIDPFGTPVPYIVPAVLSLRPKGAMLGITATDMPALCGVYPRVAMRKYGGYSIRAPFMHEIAVRLLLGKTFTVASSYDSHMIPFAVLSTDHYIRVWVRIASGRTKANRQVDNMGYIVYCEGCMQAKMVKISEVLTSEGFPHQIEECSKKIHVAGPLWIGQLFDQEVLELSMSFMKKDMDVYHKEVPHLLEYMLDEIDLVAYPYVDIHWLCDHHNLTPPKRDTILETLRENGFKASRTHFQPTAIRTDAPMRVVEETVRRLTGA